MLGRTAVLPSLNKDRVLVLGAARAAVQLLAVFGPTDVPLLDAIGGRATASVTADIERVARKFAALPQPYAFGAEVRRCAIARRDRLPRPRLRRPEDRMAAVAFDVVVSERHGGEPARTTSTLPRMMRDPLRHNRRPPRHNCLTAERESSPHGPARRPSMPDVRGYARTFAQPNSWARPVSNLRPLACEAPVSSIEQAAMLDEFVDDATKALVEALRHG